MQICLSRLQGLHLCSADSSADSLPSADRPAVQQVQLAAARGAEGPDRGASVVAQVPADKAVCGGWVDAQCTQQCAPLCLHALLHLGQAHHPRASPPEDIQCVQAYMYGMFKNKRIVLFDTLIEQCSEEQVVAVLAHELGVLRAGICALFVTSWCRAHTSCHAGALCAQEWRPAVTRQHMERVVHPRLRARAAHRAGHWKLSHTLQNLALTQAHLLLSFSLFAAVRTSPALFASFGFRDARPAIMAFMLFQFISAPLEEVLAFA